MNNQKYDPVILFLLRMVGVISIFIAVFLGYVFKTYASTITATTSIADSAWIDQGTPTANNNSDALGYFGGFGAGANYRTIFKITMPSYTGTLISAQLTWYCNSAWTGSGYEIHTVLTTPTMSEVTWNKRNSSTNWGASGGDNGALISSSGSTNTCSNATHSLDISTSTVAQPPDLSSGATSYIMITGNRETVSGLSQLANNRDSTASHRPYITYTYDDGSATTTPVNQFRYTPFDSYNSTATSSNTSPVLGSSTLYYWTNKSGSNFTQINVGTSTNYWTSSNYVYLVMDNSTSYLYNQLYIYGSSTKTNINDSLTNPDIVNSFTLDGRTVSVYRVYTTPDYKMDTFQCVSCILNTGTSTNTRLYLAYPSNSATIMNSVNSSTTLINFINTYAPASTTPSVPSTPSRYISTGASLYSQLATIVNPVTTTSYSYTSPTASTTLKQGGVIFITHASSTTPTITWNGASMARINYTTSQVQGYITSMYWISHPASSASIIISNIVASSTRFISTSVWSNGDVVANSDTYAVNLSSNRAWLDLSGTVAPVTVVGTLSATDISGYQKLPSTVLQNSATSSTGQLALFSGMCVGYGFLNDCPLGYKEIYAFGQIDGGLVGMSLYSIGTATTTAPTNTASTTFQNTTFFTDLGTEVSFSSCFNDVFSASVLSAMFYANVGNSMVCVGKNLIFWSINLFIPTSAQINELGTSLYSSVQNGNLVTSVFGFMFFLKDLSATTTPVTSVSYYGFTVPTSISGGTFSTGTQLITVNVGQVSPTTDRQARDWLSPFFAVFAVFFAGYFMIKLLH